MNTIKFVAGTALLFLIAVTTGCAGTKGIACSLGNHCMGASGRSKKMQPPAAQLAIPISCIDQVLHGTEKTRCEAIDPAHPDVALCGPVLVHFNCTKVVRSKK